MILSVQTDTKNYDIVIQSGAWHEVTRYWNLDRRVLVVTDDGVPPQYAATVAAQCKLATVVTLPQGEASKSMEQLQQLTGAIQMQNQLNSQQPQPETVEDILATVLEP